jgi:hypothetical protein
MRTANDKLARNAGTAVIETAIVMPLYLLVIFGLLYFGYATLAKQRQTMAAAYSAWLPGDQRADTTLARFWPWTVDPLRPPTAVAQPGVSGVTSGDHELNVRERARLNDPYYGTVIRTQLVAGTNTLGGAGDDTFDRERVTVSLWNLALGKTVQRFSWTPGQGLVQRFDRNFGPFGVYLNAQSQAGAGQGGAFIAADEGSPPQIGRYETMVSDALNGINSAGHWLERRQATLDAAYQPPFFRMVYAEDNAPPLRGDTYFSGNYAQPTFKPASTINFDVTGRGTAMRLAAGDPGGGYAAVLADAYALTRRARPLADGTELDTLALSVDPQSGATVSLKDAWRRQ